MSLFNWFVRRLDYKWLMDNMSCKRFASHVARQTEPLGGGTYRWFHFWLHWAICPFCRGYWNELKSIGSEAKKLHRISHHPVVKINEIKDRIREKVRGDGL